MFGQTKITAPISHYRKKSETDTGTERTGEYVFQFQQPTVIDVTISLDQLDKTKKAEIMQKLILAEKNDDEVELVGFNVVKSYKNGTSHTFTLTDVNYQPSPQNQKASS